MVVAMVVAQLKRHKMGISHTLNHSWVLQISVPAFHHNILEYNPEATAGNCCNPARSNQECTPQVNIWFGTLGQSHSSEQTCE